MNPSEQFNRQIHRDEQYHPDERDDLRRIADSIQNISHCLIVLSFMVPILGLVIFAAVFMRS